MMNDAAMIVIESSILATAFGATYIFKEKLSGIECRIMRQSIAYIFAILMCSNSIFINDICHINKLSALCLGFLMTVVGLFALSNFKNDPNRYFLIVITAGLCLMMIGVASFM